MSARVLVVEDDPTVASVFAAYLRRAGYDVEIAATGTSALERWTRWSPHVVVLDLMLPGLSGLEVLRRRRVSDDAASVLTVSARGDEDDRVLGLETGADDYLVKPVSPRELVVRVHALVRRAERLGAAGLSPRTLRLGPLTIDVGAHRVHRSAAGDSSGEQPVNLTTREFDLLAFLAAHPGQTFSKQELLARVWGWEFGDASTVTVHVRRLREKIERDPSDPTLVLTVPRVGYRSRDREPDQGDANTRARREGDR